MVKVDKEVKAGQMDRNKLYTQQSRLIWRV